MSEQVICEKAGECRELCKHKMAHFWESGDSLPIGTRGSKVSRVLSFGCHTRFKGKPISCVNLSSKPECIPISEVTA